MWLKSLDLGHRNMFWAVLELEWHFIGIQSQPKVRMTYSVAFSVVGATQCSLWDAGDHHGGQSYLPSLLMGLVLCPILRSPAKPGKKEAEKKKKTISPFSSSTAISSTSDHKASNCYPVTRLE